MILSFYANIVLKLKQLKGVILAFLHIIFLYHTYYLAYVFFWTKRIFLMPYVRGKCAETMEGVMGQQPVFSQ